MFYHRRMLPAVNGSKLSPTSTAVSARALLELDVSCDHLLSSSIYMKTWWCGKFLYNGLGLILRRAPTVAIGN